MHEEPLPSEVIETVFYLQSNEAFEAIERDPYWPKWESPWWRATLLFELGYAELIPDDIVRALIDSTNRQYLRTFPLRGEELPTDVDPYRHVMCHCALGTLYQVVDACGVDVDEVLPWFRPWILQYQLPDGGLNCDESGYLKTPQRSSIVSTLPPAEAILFCTKREFTKQETAFMDRAADYLLRRRLFRSETDGRVLDPEWLELSFPRFYFYDVLRGLNFLAQWSTRLGRELPLENLSEAIEAVRSHLDPQGRICLKRRALETGSMRMDSDGTWSFRPKEARSFALLNKFNAVGVVSSPLTKQWDDVKSLLHLP